MRYVWMAALCLALAAGQLSAQKATTLKTQKDTVSYSIGVDIGKKMKSQSLDVNADLVGKGIRDALSGSALVLTDKQMQGALMSFQQEMMAKQAENMKKVGEKNKKEGEAFLAENKKKPGVVTLPSGLQYKVIKEGTGKMPTAKDTVTTHYRGTLINGKVFDSSYDRGEPATFPVGGVIKGWTEALQLMKVGSKWQLFIPSELAYGERGTGQDIGPNATLIFDVELLDVK